jgi:hypothetical protein
MEKQTTANEKKIRPKKKAKKAAPKELTTREKLSRARQLLEGCSLMAKKEIEELATARKEGLNKAASERHKATADVDKVRDESKKAPRKEFEEVRSIIEEAYAKTLETARKARDDQLEEAASDLQAAYNEINEVAAVMKKPIIDTHKEEMKEIEDSYKLEVEKVETKKAERIPELNELIKVLEAEVADEEEAAARARNEEEAESESNIEAQG